MKKIEQILEELDDLFSEQKMSEVEPFLQDALRESMENKDFSSVITIVNELIGFYRDTSQYEKAVFYCEQIIQFMEQQGLKGGVPYATTCLNVANAYRASGEWNTSLKYYEEVKKIYDKMLTPTDSLYASYFNNLSLLYQEMGDFSKAVECLKTALVIMEAYGDNIKIAITCSNLAASLLRTGEEKQAEEYLKRALQIFIEDGERDFHYGSALSVMGELLFRKQKFEESRNYYKKALEELEKHVGKTEYYYRTKDNLEQVEQRLERQKQEIYSEEGSEENRNQKDGFAENSAEHEPRKSRGYGLFADFYYEYGEPMLKQKFSAFLDKIAIGKVGEGSDCFGFDDEFSMDHDYGPGFCMWVTRETYQQIGSYLEAEYKKLPVTYLGVERKEMVQGTGRVGVCVIEEFYERILGTAKIPETVEEWGKIDEYALAAATNGWILKDQEGIFSEIREKLLAYYPKEIWKAKIAQSLYSISQYGQYNYERMAKRNDVVTAGQCRSRFINSVMELLYLLNRTYAPYYKWMFKGLERIEEFGISKKLMQLEQIPVSNMEENKNLMEHICIVLLDGMEKKGYITKNPYTTYLEHYIGQVLERIGNDSKKEETGSSKVREVVSEAGEKTKHRNYDMGDSKQMNKKEELVDRLVQLEWQNFDKVKNEGGRADCQDDWGTFSIMRTSQYLTWNEEMLQSYIDDFETAMKKGWNLITEKYGRMMESTAWHKYEEIEEQLPVLPEEKKMIIEEIVKIQVTWMEEFALQYPYMAGNSRVIHTSEDTPYTTSFETYLRGELGTYSDKTLDLYGRFIVSYLQEGKNLTRDIMTNTALLYGYESLEKAEELLAKQNC